MYVELFCKRKWGLKCCIKCIPCWTQSVITGILQNQATNQSGTSFLTDWLIGFWRPLVTMKLPVEHVSNPGAFIRLSSCRCENLSESTDWCEPEALWIRGDYICTLFSPFSSPLRLPHYPLSPSTHPRGPYSVILSLASLIPFLASHSPPFFPGLASSSPLLPLAVFGTLPCSCHR